jgi:hypothetical protein
MGGSCGAKEETPRKSPKVRGLTLAGTCPRSRISGSPNCWTRTRQTRRRAVWIHGNPGSGFDQMRRPIDQLIAHSAHVCVDPKVCGAKQLSLTAFTNSPKDGKCLGPRPRPIDQMPLLNRKTMRVSSIENSWEGHRRWVWFFYPFAVPNGSRRGSDWPVPECARREQ